MKKHSIRLSSSALFRLIAVCVLLAIAGSFAMIQGSFVSWFIFYMLIPPFVYSILLWFIPINQFELERHTENVRLHQHDTLTMHVTLKRKTRWPLLYVIVEEVLPKGVFDTVEQQETRRLVNVGFRKEISWSYAIMDVPRGEHQLIGMYVTVSDFFGWVKKTKFVEGQRTVIVFPTTQALVYKKMFRHQSQGSLSAEQRRTDNSNVVTGIRDYEAGDRMNWIHWKSFAKTGKLQTKEFEPHKNDETWVLLDVSPSLLFESNISFAASLLVSARRQFESIHYMSALQKPFVFEKIQTDEQLQQAMVHLAGLEETEVRVKRTYSYNDSLRKAALIYFVTANLSSDWVEALSVVATSPKNCVLFIIVDPTKEHKATGTEKLAVSRGMRVIYVPANHFASAFEEGGIR